MTPNKENKEVALFEFIAKNSARITKASVFAISRLSGLSEAMTDYEAQGDEKTRQRIAAIISGTTAVLSEYMLEAFTCEFKDLLTETLRTTLPKVASDIVREDRDTWSELTINWYLAQQEKQHK